MYQPLIKELHTSPVVTMPNGDIRDLCAICHVEISQAPYYQISVPYYHGGIYHGDYQEYACSLEHAQQIDTKHYPEEPEDTALPSHEETRRQGWIHAFYPKPGYPRDTDRSGKWLVYLPATGVDTSWLQIKSVLHKGLLGRAAKVATHPRKDRYSGILKHVVCIYTYDYKDLQDVRRVRRVLREMGVSEKIGYKANETTHNLQYHNGSSRVSLYWE